MLGADLQTCICDFVSHKNRLTEVRCRADGVVVNKRSLSHITIKLMRDISSSTNIKTLF